MPFVVRKSESVDRPAAEPLPNVAETLVPSAYFRWVRLASRLAAAILLVPALPMIVLLVMLVHITSPGPGIYRQRRVGLHGKVFTLYKIRTMLRDAEARTGPVWTARNDPRITRLGRLLRPLHLDELPQLFNVLKGEMTLIGPRPERPEFTQHLARHIPGYLQRCSIMPGITGLAQINLPPDSDMDSVRRKLVLDLAYVEEAGFALDLRIFLCTATKLIGLPGMPVARLLKLERKVEVIPPEFYTSVEPAAEGAVPAPFASPAEAIPARSAIPRPAARPRTRLADEAPAR